jgi:hypothetical protein
MNEEKDVISNSQRTDLVLKGLCTSFSWNGSDPLDSTVAPNNIPLPLPLPLPLPFT